MVACATAIAPATAATAIATATKGSKTTVTQPLLRPNAIFVLADDLGYGDLGCYGQKLIETPNIDALAGAGIRFTQHYAGAPISAPSRASLLTGLHGGHSPVRNNDEFRTRGDVWNHRAMLDNPYLEGQRPMPADTRTMGHMFREAGYRTAMIGKWGLGHPGSVSTPGWMGFDVIAPRLWYPNGDGPANLYELKVQLKKGGELLDERTLKVGIRTMRLVQEDDSDGRGRSFLFEVNGKRTFCKGSCWVASDGTVAVRVTTDKLAKNVALLL
ncbi:hypothetical protein FACS1894159_01430 [Bacteroidia bacterium]|nr:hypothetical protein FACS1894159_01430 [Bacteroidia bacterium]